MNLISYVLPNGTSGHFCQHFRLLPGKCTECTACELYANENEEQVRRKVGLQALNEWIAMHPKHGLKPKEVELIRKSFQL
jgi:hypothetical protein